MGRRGSNLDLHIKAKSETKAGIKKAKEDLAKLQEQTEKSAKRMKAAMTAVGGTFTAVSGALTKAAFDTIAYGNTVNKTSEKLQISIRGYQQLRHAAESTAVPIQQMDLGLRSLTRRAAEAAAGNKRFARGFETLGVDVKRADGTLKSVEELLPDMADGFQSLGDAGKMTAAAMQTMGIGGAALIPMLQNGSEGMKEMADRADELGGVLNDDAIRAADDMQQEIDNLTFSAQGMVHEVGSEVIPIMKWWATTITDLVRETDVLNDALSRPASTDEARKNIKLLHAQLKEITEQEDKLIKVRDERANKERTYAEEAAHLADLVGHAQAVTRDEEIKALSERGIAISAQLEKNQKVIRAATEREADRQKESAKIATAFEVRQQEAKNKKLASEQERARKERLREERNELKDKERLREVAQRKEQRETEQSTRAFGEWLKAKDDEKLTRQKEAAERRLALVKEFEKKINEHLEETSEWREQKVIEASNYEDHVRNAQIEAWAYYGQMLATIMSSADNEEERREQVKRFILMEAARAGAAVASDAAAKLGWVGIPVAIASSAAIYGAVGALANRLNAGGFVQGAQTNKDTVHASLTPGEFVLSTGHVEAIQDLASKVTRSSAKGAAFASAVSGGIGSAPVIHMQTTVQTPYTPNVIDAMRFNQQLAKEQKKMVARGIVRKAA